MQSKKHSRYEALTNTGIAFVYASILNYLLLTWPISDNKAVMGIWVTFWFTIISYFRQYYTRRFFNKIGT